MIKTKSLLRKLGLLAMTVIIILGVVGLSGCNNYRVAKPFTEEEILSSLEAKYEEGFVINGITAVEKRSSKFVRRIYEVSPQKDLYRNYTTDLIARLSGGGNYT